MKRLMDILIVVPGLIVLSPLFIVIGFITGLSSKGSIFFVQNRVGKNNRDFKLIKFRTMYTGAPGGSPLTIGVRDPRITRAGYYLRKYKLDELPQLFNVLAGEMSLVGPRPELRKYVDLYDELQLSVLKVKPGITDPASLAYFEESELLASAKNPEETYIREIMPAKLKLNIEYIRKASVVTDTVIILKTLRRIFSPRP